MSGKINAKAIATRMRSLLGGQHRKGIEATARRLDVSEIGLRMSIDPDEPHPTVEVMAAVAAHYGIDPIWLLSGDCDCATHMAAIVEEGAVARTEMARIIARKLATGLRSSNDPVLRLEA